MLLLVLSPLLLAAALAIAIESGGPVLFRQERVGKGFRPFTILKFRTMRVESEGPLITVDGDNRVTGIGRMLRLTKIDELPQLWNVLRGDMSLVGPRPEVPEYVAWFPDRFRIVLSVRPGITDFASIAYRNEEAILARSPDPVREYRERILPAKLELAEKYIRERSILADCVALAKTAVVMLSPRQPSPEAASKRRG
jgi:lipopolysaccharide/colanic/teichoic acid biosynthesis glycosyltransferase